MTPKFDPTYHEERALADGRRLRMRAIRAEDKARLAEGMEKLSPEARFSRFFAAKSRLTQAELRYLTELDGRDHYALGVSVLEPDGSEGEGAGVGRFIRSRDDPAAAEPAIVVVDAWQGRGIGKWLLDRLIAAAREREIRYFRAECLAENHTIQHLFERLGPSVRKERRGQLVALELPIFEVRIDGDAAGATPSEALLRMAAERRIRFRPPG